MTRFRERLLKGLLWFIGVSALFALVAVFMPMPWMAGIHRSLGLGDMPAAPIVEYLARSLSAFYVIFRAPSCLLAVSDLDRYRPLVRLLGSGFLLMGCIFIWIDVATGMPWWWSACEGPPQIVVGSLFLLLARSAPRQWD